MREEFEPIPRLSSGWRACRTTGGKVTLRPQSIDGSTGSPWRPQSSQRRGSHEVRYDGDGPYREATPCFGTQPHCLQVQLARHCLLANEPSASVAPSEVWCRRRDSNPHGLPHTPLKRACLPVPPLRRWPNYRSASKRLSINCLFDRIPANTWRWRPP